MIELLKAAMKNLYRRRLRTFLTICSIAVGLTAVVIIFTISGYGKSFVSQELESMGLGGIMVSKTSSQQGFSLDKEEEIAAIRAMEGVEEVIPVVAEYSQLSLRNMLAETIVWGIDCGDQQLLTLQTLYGRMLQKGDIQQQSRVCVIDQALAEKIYKRSNIVGKTIKLSLGNQYETFEIVGVVASGGSLLQNVLSGYIPYFVYVPYTTLQAATGKQDFNQLAVTFQDHSDIEQQGEKLVEVLNRLAQDQSYRFDNISAQTDKLIRLMDVISLILAVIASISLLVAGIGIMTVMLVSVSERTKEIGIKKAIGASRNMILKEFLAESFAISSAGGCIGLMAGILLSLAASAVMGTVPRLEWGSYLLSFFFTVGIGILFGIYPAVKAAALRPVDALRKE